MRVTVKLFTKKITRNGKVVAKLPFLVSFRGFIGFDKRFTSNWFAHKKNQTHFLGFRVEHSYGYELVKN